MDAAPLWQLVALLAKLEPGSIGVIGGEFGEGIELVGVSAEFRDYLHIAEWSVVAGTLSCLPPPADLALFKIVLMKEFLRWAKSKALPIPPELSPQDGVGMAPTDAGVSTRVEGIKGLRDLIKELGLTLGDDAAVRNFAKRAGIMRDGENEKHEKRSWERAEIEPKLRAEVARRLQGPPK